MHEQVATLVYQSALLLDEGNHRGFLDLCAADFQYTISAYSPELRRPMVWLDQDKEGLALLFENLPRHHSEPVRLSRHVTLYTVESDGAAGEARAVSALQVFRTVPDGGATTLFAVGKLQDTVRVGPDGVRLVRRRVSLDTRLLGLGSHVPF